VKNLSTRDALLVLRKVIAADAEKAEKINELTSQLNKAVSSRAAAVEAALGTLEGYVALHSQMHGFNNDLEELAATASRPAKAKTSAKKKKKKKKKTRSPVGESLPQRSTGWPGRLASSIELPEKSQLFVDILTQRWPVFTSPQWLARQGAISTAAQVTAKVNALRKKGVPIESARQARGTDPSVSKKARGYRLVG
jgi:biotin operon repressor